MPIPTDPLLPQQWHLGNTGGLLDLNVRGVWNPAQGSAYTGAGVRVVVIDNGFDYNHVDLAGPYDDGLDYDFVDNDLDPFGADTESHGTAVAGIIGADDNGIGVVGIAFDSSLVGYRTANLITDDWLQDIRDAIHHAALSAQGDVANISQGIANDENSEYGAGYNAVRFDEIETSIGEAVGQGRGGLGMTIVKSAGNSRSDDYDVNADDWTNDTRQVVVAAVDQNGFVSSYSSYGAANLVSGFGTPGQVLTTDRTGAAGYNSTDYTYSFNGTSAAAPMVTGVVALMYDANAALGWRDVQSILGVSARHVGSAVGGGTAGSERYTWAFNAASTWNGGGQHFSNDYGYGLVDATAAVRLAETWLLGGQVAQTNGNQFTNTMDMLNGAVVIPDGNATGTSFTGTAGFNDIVERVTVEVSFSTTYLADMEIYLISPSGTVSELIDDVAGSADFNGTWTYESQAFRGERAGGTWTVRIVDDAGGDVLTVSDVVVRTFGADSLNDRYVYTNEYSDYDGTFGHAVAVVDGNGGTDTVNAAAVTAASTIRLDGTASTIDGVATTFTNIENAIGGDGADRIYGSADGNQLFGMRGNDTMSGGSGTDTLRGGDGNDRLSQGFGGPNEILDGGDGNDTADWSYSTFDSWTIDLAAGTAKIDAVTFAQLISIENVIGSQAADSVLGSDLGNYINGNNGNDTLNGGSGTDTLIGGDGDDRLIQYFGGPNEVMDGGIGNDTGDWSYSTGEGWVFSLIDETARIDGVVYAILNSLENIIAGQDSDCLYGNNGNNRLDGQDGNDTIDGGGGNDTMTGGAGNDTYYVANKLDQVIETLAGGAGGTDTVNSSVGFSLGANVENLVLTGAANIAGTGNELANLVSGNTGNNKILGGDGNDTLQGGEGDDELRGGIGLDRMNGGNGNDRYFVDDAGDQTIENNADPAIGGIDTVYASINRTLGANLENLRLQANADINGNGNGLDNKIYGNSGMNILKGLVGNDTIDGKGGADTIDGGEGNDTLTGGAQADVFRFATANAGVDRILDFNKNGDRFDLSGGTFTAVSLAPNGDAVLTHTGGTIRIAAPPTLTLAQWNALVLPSGARAAADDLSLDGLDHAAFRPAHDFHGDWIIG